MAKHIGNTKVTISTGTTSVETDTDTLKRAGENIRRLGNLSADQLRSIVERIERLEEEKSGIASDIRDIYAEAAANGYDKTAIRELIKLRKLDNHERDERQYTLDLYCRALGMKPAEEEEA